nr:MAG TPA: hypothetical protein [Caudoviricetes sp.]
MIHAFKNDTYAAARTMNAFYEVWMNPLNVE